MAGNLIIIIIVVVVGGGRVAECVCDAQAVFLNRCASQSISGGAAVRSSRLGRRRHTFLVISIWISQGKHTPAAHAAPWQDKHRQITHHQLTSHRGQLGRPYNFTLGSSTRVCAIPGDPSAGKPIADYAEGSGIRQLENRVKVSTGRPVHWYTDRALQVQVTSNSATCFMFITAAATTILLYYGRALVRWVLLRYSGSFLTSAVAKHWRVPITAGGGRARASEASAGGCTARHSLLLDKWPAEESARESLLT